MDAREHNVFEGRPAVRYLGQYKPTEPYTLSSGLVILPGGSGMFQHGRGGQVHLNISYLTGPDSLSETALMSSYREWLAFDTLVLQDHFPILFYDENDVGGVERVPADVPRSARLPPDYKQINYDNIAPTKLPAGQPEPEGLPIVSYESLFAAYEKLDIEVKEMIEWYMSLPHRAYTRLNAFFNVNYWQLVHATVLLERLIGLPPPCLHAFGKCPECGFSPQPHHSIPRRDWVRKVLATRVQDSAVAKEYAQVIDTGVLVRNRITDVPLFDRASYPELSPGERQTYGIDRAVTEYDHDGVALQSLLISLREVARYLLLDRAFGTRYFGKLRPLNVVRIGSSKASDVGTGEAVV